MAQTLSVNGVAGNLDSTALSKDGTTVDNVYTVSFTQNDLNGIVARAQAQLAQINIQIANLQANAINIQATIDTANNQLALFPVQVPLGP